MIKTQRIYYFTLYLTYIIYIQHNISIKFILSNYVVYKINKDYILLLSLLTLMIGTLFIKFKIMLEFSIINGIGR